MFKIWSAFLLLAASSSAVTNDEETGTTGLKPRTLGNLALVYTVFDLGRGFTLGQNGGYASGWRGSYHTPSIQVHSTQPLLMESTSGVHHTIPANQALGWKRSSGTYKKDHSYQSGHGYGTGMGWKRGYFSMLG